MKLRIRGNSVRLRVSQSELEQIVGQGFAGDRVQFGGAATLSYCVEVVPDEPLAADFADGEIRLRVPRRRVRSWAQPGEVSIRGEQPLADGAALKILIEKDFSCLAPREGEDETDLFPNPRAETG
jgi:hypothetical protein